jgi:Protein of unknown function (DUF2894)
MTASPTQPTWQALLELQATLRAAGAAQWDAMGWHYIECLANRAGQQTGLTQSLLCNKLQQALGELKARGDAAAWTRHGPTSAQMTQPTASMVASSPLAALLQEMAPTLADADSSSGADAGAHKHAIWRAESPRVRQFRKQLGQIQVQKQVSQAIAQAPQNAGPINSHMLVLRSLGLMRDASPDYLNRFMAHVDTLLCLDEAGQGKLPHKKTRR